MQQSRHELSQEYADWYRPSPFTLSRWLPMRCGFVDFFLKDVAELTAQHGFND